MSLKEDLEALYMTFDTELENPVAHLHGNNPEHTSEPKPADDQEKSGS